MSAAVMAVFIPTLAWGSADARSARSAADAGFIAHDTDGPPFYYFQDASSTDAADNTVTIPVGGTVSFAYSTSGQSHNAYFVDGTPSSCTVDSGPFPAGPAAVPQYPVPGPWSGSCRFATAGTYRFVCQAHTAMDGIVVVEATPTATATATATQSPTPTATETATVAPTQTPTATPPPVVVAATPSPTVSPAPQPFAKLSKPASLKLKTFAGRGLKASGGCTAGGSGKLALTISRAAAKQLKLKGTTLATGTAKCDGSGRMTATLKPGAAAKKALKRQRKALATTLTLTVGSAKASVKVTLK